MSIREIGTGAPKPLALHLPRPVPGEIRRTHAVKLLRDMFSPERRIVLVEGEEYSGKTVLLSQFCREIDGLVIGYFIGNDYWSSSPGRFLESFCLQINEVVRGFAPEALEGLPEVDLRSCFDRLYRMLTKKLEREGWTCYFVVDGLDHAASPYEENSIITYLPTDLPSGMYLLLSSRPGRQFPFKFHRIPMPVFSHLETQSILSDHLTREQIAEVHQKSGGLPGYVGEVLRQLQEGRDPRNVIASLPGHLRGLIEKQWNEQTREPRLRRLLAVLAYSVSEVDVDTLATVCSEPREYVVSALASVPFVRVDGNTIIFATPVHRSYLREILAELRAEALQLLISYTEQHPQTEKAALELPMLYRESGGYEQLVKFLRPESLAEVLSITHSPSMTLGNFAALAEEASRREDWTVVTYATLAHTVLRFLIQRQPPLEDEIEALLQMNLIDEAVSAASACTFPEDQLSLFARIGATLGRKQIPVPQALLAMIEQATGRIGSLVEMGDRLFPVIADLFVAHPDTALKLIQRLRSERTGLGSLDGHAWDDFLAALALGLDLDLVGEDEFSRPDQRESLLDFLRIASTDFESISLNALFEKVDSTSDASAKAFLLLGWMRTHRGQTGIAEALSRLLDILQSDYPPTLRRLRQAAEFLPDLQDLEVKRELVDRLCLLQGTVARSPVEEAVRLELLIAQAEAMWSPDSTTKRLEKVYLDDLVEIDDKDVRCAVLTHLLIAVDRMSPTDASMKEMILEDLRTEFREMLESSADHWFVSRKVIGALADKHEYLALEMARMLNTSSRRDQAFEYILRVYTRKKPCEIRVGFVLSVLKEIRSRSLRERTLLNVLRRISRDKSLDDDEAWASFETYADSVRDKSTKIYSYCHILKGIPDTTQGQFMRLWEKIVGELQHVSSPEPRLAVKLAISKILAERYLEAAKEIYDTVQEEKTGPLVAGGLSDLYAATLHLAVRMIPDVIKSRNRDQMIEDLISAIEAIPDLSFQIDFLSDVAVRLHLSRSPGTEFNKLVTRVLDLIDLDPAEEPYHLYLAGPAVFEYSSELLERRLSRVDPLEADAILMRIARYVLSGRSPNDPVDLETSTCQADYQMAEKCCWLLERMSQDSLISSTLNQLVRRLVQPNDRGGERTCLREHQLLPITERLSKVIRNKLPDPHNIKHDGFRLVAFSHLCRLRSAASRSKPFRSRHWTTICPSFADLARDARAIPNLADRPYVMMLIGSDSYRSDQALGQALLNEAGELIEKCGNSTDKADRYLALAMEFLDLGNDNSARYFLERAFEAIMNVAKEERGHENRESLESIIEVAHKISPDFASSLTSKIDDLMSREYCMDAVEVANLRANPSGIASIGHVPKRILRQAARRIMRSLCSGRIGAVNDEVVGHWIQVARGTDVWTAYPVLQWFVENAVLRTKPRSESYLDDLFYKNLSLLGTMVPLAQMTFSAAAQAPRPRCVDNMNIWIFKPGEEAQMLEKISDFIQEHGAPYTKIYDRFFAPRYLTLLKAALLNARVIIITENRPNSRKSEADFRNAWRQISDMVPPSTEVYLFEGPTPMHDRFFICKNAGLSVGTSVTGYGKSDTVVRLLDEDERVKIEREIVDKMLYDPPLEHEGHRLSRKIFSL